MIKKIIFIICLICMFPALVSAQSQQIDLKAGYNFISFNITPSVTPQQLKTQYPHIEDIFLYHALSGGFLGLNEGTLVSLSAGKGYVVKSTQDQSITVNGTALGTVGNINLMPDFNLVGFSKAPETITFSQLMTRYSVISGIYKWIPTAGTFAQVVRDGSGNIVQISGIDPVITAGESYFFNIKNQCSISYDNASILISGNNVTDNNVSTVTAANGKLTVHFINQPTPLAISASDFTVNVSIDSAPFTPVIPVSVTRYADGTAEIFVEQILPSPDAAKTIIYKVAYLSNSPIVAPSFTISSITISSITAVNGKLTIRFTGGPLPQPISNFDFALKVSIDSGIANNVTPISIMRQADGTAEIFVEQILPSANSDRNIVYMVSYRMNTFVYAPSFIVPSNGKVLTPTFSIPEGSYNTMQILTLSSATPGAEIYCTIDGSEPVAYYGYKYYPGVFGPFTLLKTKTIKAIAVKRGMINSDVVSATYTMTIPPVVEISGTNIVLFMPIPSVMPGVMPGMLTFQLLNTANNFQPLCNETATYNPIFNANFNFNFNLTETDIVPLIVAKYNGKVLFLKLMQKMPKASEISAKGIVKINITASGSDFLGSRSTVDSLIALEKNLTSTVMQVNSNDEIVNFSYNYNYLSDADYSLFGGISNPVITLSQILSSDYISPEVKELVQPSFTYTATSLLNSFLTAIKHPQAKIFLDSRTYLSRNTTINSVVINDQTTSIPSDLLTNIQLTVLSPVISPASDNYLTPQTITLTCATADASIYYTTDGSVPSNTNGTIYTAAFNIAASTVVKAIAYKTGMVKSNVATAGANSNVPPPMPISSPMPGTFPNAALSVILTTPTPGATIRYTTDLSVPTLANGMTSPSPAMIAIPAGSTTTIKAIAVNGSAISPVFIGTYTTN